MVTNNNYSALYYARRDDNGKTPLHAAASGLKVEGTIETVDYLLKHGAMKMLNKASSETERVKTCSFLIKC